MLCQSLAVTSGMSYISNENGIMKLIKLSTNFNPRLVVFMFSVPTDVINLSGEIRIWKSSYYGGQAM